MVASANIDPAALFQEWSEISLHNLGSAGKGVCILFTQRVEMQSAYPLFHNPCRQMAQTNAQTRPWRAGIIHGHSPFAVLGIDAQPGLYTLFGKKIAIRAPLGNGVEDNGVRKAHQLFHFSLCPGSGKGVNLAAEFLSAKPGLVNAAGASSPQGPLLGP